MTIWDDRILEFIRREGSGSPKELEESGYFEISRAHISRRLGVLRDHGLLTHLGNGIYVITERGEQYLDGEISTREDLPDDVPSAGESGDERTGEGVNGV